MVRRASPLSPAPDLSVVIPFFEEEENVVAVIEELAGVLDGTGRSYEILGVDDGSADATLSLLVDLRERLPPLRVVRMRRNSGQTAAMQAGFERARGKVVFSMDGDGQNDPAAIPDLLRVIEQGYDLVCGWRARRQDRWMSRKLPSWVANRVIAAVTGVPIHDNGCSLKAYKLDLLRRLRLYGEQHRFIPSLAALRGARIAEVRVPHRARRAGQSKYGLSRTYKVLIDLATIRFLRPLAVAPALPFLAVASVAAAAGLAALGASALIQGTGGSLVVVSGVAILLIYLAGYLSMMALVSELLRHQPGLRMPGPVHRPQFPARPESGRSRA